MFRLALGFVNVAQEAFVVVFHDGAVAASASVLEAAGMDCGFALLAADVEVEPVS